MKQKLWDEKSMLAAIRTAQEGVCSNNYAARDHGVPSTTLSVIHGTNYGPMYALPYDSGRK